MKHRFAVFGLLVYAATTVAAAAARPLVANANEAKDHHRSKTRPNIASDGPAEDDKVNHERILIHADSPGAPTAEPTQWQLSSDWWYENASEGSDNQETTGGAEYRDGGVVNRVPAPASPYPKCACIQEYPSFSQETANPCPLYCYEANQDQLAPVESVENKLGDSDYRNSVTDPCVYCFNQKTMHLCPGGYACYQAYQDQYTQPTEKPNTATSHTHKSSKSSNEATNNRNQYTQPLEKPTSHSHTHTSKSSNEGTKDVQTDHRKPAAPMPSPTYYHQWPTYHMTTYSWPTQQQHQRQPYPAPVPAPTPWWNWGTDKHPSPWYWGTPQPTAKLSEPPTSQPTRTRVTSSPSDAPSSVPTGAPSCTPSAFPSMRPSRYPSQHPSMRPSRYRNQHPSSYPSWMPSDEPSSSPSFSHQPSTSHSPSSYNRNYRRVPDGGDGSMDSSDGTENSDNSDTADSSAGGSHSGGGKGKGGNVRKTRAKNDDDRRLIDKKTSKTKKSKKSDKTDRSGYHVDHDHGYECACCTCNNRWEYDEYYEMWHNAYYEEWYSEYYNQFYRYVEQYYKDPWNYGGGKGKGKSKSSKSSKSSKGGKGKGGSGSRSSDGGGGGHHYPGGGGHYYPGGGGGGHRGAGNPNRCNEDFYPPGREPGSGNRVGREPSADNLSESRASKKSALKKVPIIAGGVAGLTVAVTAAAFFFVLRDRNRQTKTEKSGSVAETEQSEDANDDNHAGTMTKSTSKTKGITKSRRSSNDKHRPKSSSGQVEQVRTNSALPSYLSGIDMSTQENVEVSGYGLSSATPVSDMENGDGAGKQVRWRDGDKKRAPSGDEIPGLMQQMTWESLTSWLSK